MTADTKGTGCEHLTVLNIGLSTLLVQNIKQHTVLCLRRNDNHVLEVLSTSTNQRNTANINLLNDISLVSTTGNSLLKGIKVNDNQVDLRNLVLSHLLTVALIIATTQDSSEHFRMQCLHTATQDRRIGRYILNLLTLIALLLNELLRTTCRQEANALLIKLLQQLVQPIFVEHRNQCCFDLSNFSHTYFYITLYV